VGNISDPAALLIPSAISTFESVPAAEAEAIAAVTRMIEDRVRAAAAKTGVARRDAHPKAHGCVEARLQVMESLP
jgi:hypothetical protein